MLLIFGGVSLYKAAVKVGIYLPCYCANPRLRQASFRVVFSGITKGSVPVGHRVSYDPIQNCRKIWKKLSFVNSYICGR